MEQLTKLAIWKSLEGHAQSFRLRVSKQASSCALNKAQFSASACDIHLDFSNQHITQETLELLFSLANKCQLQEKINALFRGDNVNVSENRPALHTALRNLDEKPIYANQQNVMPEIIATREKMQAIIEKIRNKQWLGFSGKPIVDIVNIGIGGSALGPKFCLKALEEYTIKELRYHFILDSDPSHFETIVGKLNPETTLFIVSSKSFTTQETLYNAKKARAWIGEVPLYQQHFIAVTAFPKKAQQFGIKHILPIWDWVGGRYSFCSAVNLISAIALGFDQFQEILTGAYRMDKHFQESSFAHNLPVLLALLGVWNNNFLHIHNLLILAYANQLEHFIPYIQQLDMESNGKSIDKQGKTVNYATGPVVWGGLGNQAQHSYFQLLCQGTHKITADFISLDKFNGQIINEMCNSRIKTLANGIRSEKNPAGYIPGNIPLNHLRLRNYSPATIGALVALYEHKIFTQSVIWNINPFDQPGVESAKQNHPLYFEQLEHVS